MSENYDGNMNKAYSGASAQTDKYDSKFDGLDRLILERSLMRSALNMSVRKFDNVMASPGD